MANTHETLTGLFSDIADSIREKTGQSGTIVADNFPTAIDGIATPVLQSKSATPSLSAQTITPDSPNNGLSSVSVSAVTKGLLATLDADFVAENIKKDVDILGLIGTLESGGGAKIATGIFTIPTKMTSGSIEITHNLGAVPDFSYLFLINPRMIDTTDVNYQLGYEMKFDSVFYSNFIKDIDFPSASRFGQQIYGTKNSQYICSANVLSSQSPSGNVGALANANETSFIVKAENYLRLFGSGTTYGWLVAKF